MPIYEFECGTCHQSFEEYFSSTHSSIEEVICPRCSSKSANKKLSVFSTAVFEESAPVNNTGMGMCCGGSCGLN